VGDQTAVRWTALEDFTAGPAGLLLPATVIAELREAAAAVARRADAVRQQHPASPTTKQPAGQGERVGFRRSEPPAEPAFSDPRVHEVHRIDALPPDAEPDLRRYRCQTCNWVTGDVFGDGIHKLVEYP
jgi:hypothetical protein